MTLRSGSEYSAGGSDHFEQGLEPYHPDHYAIIDQPSPLPEYRARPGWATLTQPYPLAGKFRQIALGHWTNDDVSHGDRISVRQWQVECRTCSSVVLTTPGHWVIGALANNQWSFAGWGTKSVDALLVQPFINYNFSHGWYITSAPIITANWEAASDERWTVPIGGGVGKILKIDKLPINTSLAAYCNVVTPQHGGADWQLRFQMQFLFPK